MLREKRHPANGVIMAGPTALFKTGSPVKQDCSLDVIINLLNLWASLPTLSLFKMPKTSIPLPRSHLPAAKLFPQCRRKRRAAGKMTFRK